MNVSAPGLSPDLDDLAVDDAVDVGAGDRDLAPRRSVAEERAGVGAAEAPAGYHLVSLGGLVLDADGAVGQR